MTCLMGASHNMTADIMKLYSDTSGPVEDLPGGWVNTQDKESGAIIRKWELPKDKPNTPEDESISTRVKCSAKAVLSRGARNGSANESFGATYSAVNYINMKVGPNVSITTRDRVTNIRSADGKVIWKVDQSKEDSAPLVFDVEGIIPITNPFGIHVETLIVLNRSEAQ